MLQGTSTCKRDEDFKIDTEETWGVMNLDYLTTSPYLKHPIWFLGTMNNTNCRMHTDPTEYWAYSEPMKIRDPEGITQNYGSSASLNIQNLRFFFLLCIALSGVI